MILHHVSDDAKLVEVSSSAFRSERLLERYLYIVDVVAVPCCPEKLIAESQNQNILHHFLPQVVVDAEDLFFFPVRFQSLLKLPGATKVLAERLLDDNSRDTVLWIAILFEMLRDCDEDAGGESHVEDPIVFRPSLLNLLEMFVELLE